MRRRGVANLPLMEAWKRGKEVRHWLGETLGNIRKHRPGPDLQHPYPEADKPKSAAIAPTADTGKSDAGSLPIYYQSAPDNKWHCSVLSPEGYGFELAFNSEADFLSLLDSLKECANDPAGLSAHLQHTTEVLTPPRDSTSTDTKDA